jgi:hypothetical protein
MKRLFSHPVFAILLVLSLTNSAVNAQIVTSTASITKSNISKTDNTVNVVLQSFELSRAGNSVKINWQTSIEKNNNYFEILRSTDGIQFNVIALMFAKEDADNGASYRYTDQESAKFNADKVYYRLRIIDITGKSIILESKKIALTETAIPQ